MIEVSEAKRLLTAEAFYALDLPLNREQELIRGEVVEMSPAATWHSRLAAHLVIQIGIYVQAQDLGEISTEGGGYLLAQNPDTVRMPDIGFTRKERIQTGLTFDTNAPDLVVEIVSPGNTSEELHEKMDEYFRAETQIVWLVFAKWRTVEVYMPQTRRVYRKGERLDGGDVLPGFTLAVDSLFAPLDKYNV